MSFLQTYLIRMVAFLAACVVAGAFIAPQLQNAFVANLWLNGFIILILIVGIAYSFIQVLGLRGEIYWLETLRRESRGGLVFPGTLSQDRPPRLLGPMVTMIGDKAGRLSLSTMSMRSLLDTIQARIEESHEISRYVIGLLIFLGLLGTFWGLLDTVNAVGETIGGLSGGSGDAVALFEELKGGLQAPLSGMGTAFSSSLFGLAGSLVLGFLELNSAQAHNRFLNELEEWLSSVTKLSSGGGFSGEGEQPVSAYVHALLEKTADSLEQLQRTVARGEEDRASVNQNLVALSERLSSLTDHMRTEQSVMLSIAETQASLKPLLQRLADSGREDGGGLDKATKGHIRNLDLRLERISAEMAHGRESAVEELRSEIRLLTRTLAAMAEEG
ncbi:flagellar motor protein MotA [Pelagibius marinus]|uniref:flagellar motor protein MotA n=1 Tax=Pelagibius marinus TaxID=2762760 RepID=UPI0018728236|nr:flagellar motor protein MotA [Pelagibius marinus]